MPMILILNLNLVTQKPTQNQPISVNIFMVSEPRTIGERGTECETVSKNGGNKPTDRSLHG